jgi:hypothetical protein
VCVCVCVYFNFCLPVYLLPFTHHLFARTYTHIHTHIHL